MYIYIVLLYSHHKTKSLKNTHVAVDYKNSHKGQFLFSIYT